MVSKLCRWSVYAFVFIGIYPVGVPLMCMAMLWKVTVENGAAPR